MARQTVKEMSVPKLEAFIRRMIKAMRRYCEREGVYGFIDDEHVRVAETATGADLIAMATRFANLASPIVDAKGNKSPIPPFARAVADVYASALGISEEEIRHSLTRLFFTRPATRQAA